ncbi:MAG: hypothetical protein AB3N23_22220, partial [Paracoccaceae bacterium]
AFFAGSTARRKAATSASVICVLFSLIAPMLPHVQGQGAVNRSGLGYESPYMPLIQLMEEPQ